MHYTHTTQGEKYEKSDKEREAERQKVKRVDRDRLTDRQTEKKMDRQTYEQTDRQASRIRQMDIIRKRYIKILLHAFCVSVSAIDVSLLASTCQLFSLLGPACTGVRSCSHKLSTWDLWPSFPHHSVGRVCVVVVVCVWLCLCQRLCVCMQYVCLYLSACVCVCISLFAAVCVCVCIIVCLYTTV